MVGGILNINDMQTINLNGNKHDDKLDSVRYTFEKIAKEIVERQDNAMAMEFTKTIGKLLLDNNVKPVVVENKFTAEKENSITQTYGVAITKLDFTEHDKPFKDKIEELEEVNYILRGQVKDLRKKLEDNACFSRDVEKQLGETLINVGQLKGVDTAHGNDYVVTDCKYSDDYTLVIYLGQLIKRKDIQITVAPERIEFIKELLHMEDKN